jgi:hypothetical protein
VREELESEEVGDGIMANIERSDGRGFRRGRPASTLTASTSELN